MIYRSVFLRARFYEVLLFLLSWAITVGLANIADMSSNESSLMANILYGVFLVVVISLPFIMLDSFYTQDYNKSVSIDEENNMVECCDGDRTICFSLSDIISVTWNWCYLYFLLGYYEIQIKDKEPIRVSVFTPIKKIVEYAKHNDIYKRQGHFLADMN